MKDPNKISEWIEMHLEMQGKSNAERLQEETLNEESMSLPPRNTVFPSQRGKWVRIFYHTLLFLFLCLVVGLTIWGAQQHAP